MFFALHGGQVLGTCALRKESDETYELCKIAVAPEAQGLGLGDALAALGRLGGRVEQAGWDHAAVPTVIPIKRKPLILSPKLDLATPRAAQ